MILKLAQKNKIPLINIVRREEQVTLLKKKYGAKHVLNSSEDGFLEKVKELAKELKATALIECVAGNLTGQLID